MTAATWSWTCYLLVLIVFTLGAWGLDAAIAATGQPGVENAGQLLRRVVPIGIPVASCPTVGPALAIVPERAVLYFLNPAASALRQSSSVQTTTADGTLPTVAKPAAATAYTALASLINGRPGAAPIMRSTRCSSPFAGGLSSNRRRGGTA
jgi:hypothetical protein